MQDLPIELIRYIFHLSSLPAYPLPPNSRDDPLPLTVSGRRYLASLALVHRSWTPLVEDELLRYVYIGPEGPRESLQDLLRKRVAERKSGIKSLVLEGSYAPVAAWDLSRDERVWKDVRALRLFSADAAAREVVERCSNLRLLVLHAPAPSFRLNGDFPHLRHLAVMHTAGFNVVQSLDPTRVPQLDTLVVDLTRGADWSLRPQMRAPPPPQQPVQAAHAALPFGTGVLNNGRRGFIRLTPATATTGVTTRLQARPPRPTPTFPAFPSLPIFPQIKDLTLRVDNLPHSIPFLQSLLASSISPFDSTVSTAALAHLRLETSGASEEWMALSPVLSVLDALETPLKSFHIAYALLEPLLFRLSCTSTSTSSTAMTFPRCLSRLEYLTLSHFLSLSHSARGDVDTGEGYVVRRVEPNAVGGGGGGWKDLASLRQYLEMFVQARARFEAKEGLKEFDDAETGKGGMLVELRKQPAGIVGEDGMWRH